MRYCEKIIGLQFKRAVIFLLSIYFPFTLSFGQNICSFISKLQHYQKMVGINFNNQVITVDSLTFDFNSYLDMFDKLGRVEGKKYYLYYSHTYLDGSPIIYALPENFDLQKFVDTKVYNEPKYRINSDPDDKTMRALLYHNIVTDSSRRAYNFLIPDDSEEGFLQYLFFYVMGEQFALYWHALDFQKRIICSKDELEDLIRTYKKSELFDVDKKQLKALSSLDPTPIISSDNNEFTISWYELDTHKGLYVKTYEIDRKTPFEIRTVNSIKKIEIQKKFMY